MHAPPEIVCIKSLDSLRLLLVQSQALHVLITPRACARGKVIGCVVVVVVVVSTKIAISRDIGI